MNVGYNSCSLCKLLTNIVLLVNLGLKMLEQRGVTVREELLIERL